MDCAHYVDGPRVVVVSAIELRGWPQEQVLAAEFQCLGCPAPMHPRGLPEGSRVVPHFATRKFAEHVGCEPDDPVKGNAAVVGGVSSGRGEVIRPTRLVDREPRKIDGERASGLPTAEDQRPSSRTGPSTAGAGTSGSAVAYSIRPFAAAFTSMTSDQRRAEPIELPGVSDADRYQFAFKELPTWSIVTLPRRRVFHAQLRKLDGQPQLRGDSFVVELFAGSGYDRTTRRFARPWTVAVDCSGWSPSRKSLFLAEYEQAVAQAKTEPGRVAKVYALADQNTSDDTQLVVTSRAHVTFIAVEVDRVQ